MITRNPLGKSGLMASKLGFGCWGLGGDSYGAISPKTIEKTLLTALDQGINFYDTSDSYGAGTSEILLGQAFRSRRSEVIFATKFGNLPHRGFEMPQDFSVKHLDFALKGTLSRLNTDYLDLYQLHSPPRDCKSLPEIFEKLATLKKEGLIRAYGVSPRSPEDALFFAKNFKIDSIQINLNLIDQRAVENGLLNECVERGIGVIARTPLCFGYLTGTLTGEEEFGPLDHRSNWPKAQRRLWASAPRLFQELLSNGYKSVTQLALNYCVSLPGVSTVIPGMLTPEEVLLNAEAFQAPSLSAPQLERAHTIYKSNSFFDKSAKSSGQNAQNANAASQTGAKADIGAICATISGDGKIVDLGVAEMLDPTGREVSQSGPNLSSHNAQNWAGTNGHNIELLLIPGDRSLIKIVDLFNSWAPCVKAGGTIALCGYDSTNMGGADLLAMRIFGQAIFSKNALSDLRSGNGLLIGTKANTTPTISMEDCCNSLSAIQKEIHGFVELLQSQELDASWKTLAMRAVPFNGLQACFGLDYLLRKDQTFLREHSVNPPFFRKWTSALESLNNGTRGLQLIMTPEAKLGDPRSLDDLSASVSLEQTRLRILLEILNSVVLWTLWT